jgi:hypothetical protein
MSTTYSTPSTLIRLAGLSAAAAGIYFAVIQPIHPPDVVASVTTTAWAVITTLKTAMCFLFLFGTAGLYAAQADRAGRLGVAGALLFGLSWWIQTGFVFAETFVLPLLATSAPAFVDGVLGISYGRASEVDLGLLPAIYAAVGILYMIGGLVFGIATLRARVLPRGAAALMAVTATLTPAAAFHPHHIQRLAAVPMGLAFAWLGLALWLGHRRGAHAAQPAPVEASAVAPAAALAAQAG